jgi:hypothetical protein
MVGHNLTLADAYLVHVLSGPFKYLFEKKTRLDKLPNLTRFMTLNLDQYFFQFGYGQTVLCKKQAKIPAQPAAEDKGKKPAADQSKKPAAEQSKKPEAKKEKKEKTEKQK